MPRGGPRPNSGRPPSEARQLMREIALDPTAVEKALEHARKNPDFWIKCYEAGFGRPPQAMRLTLDKPSDATDYIAAFEEGEAFDPAALVPVPEGAPN